MNVIDSVPTGLFIDGQWREAAAGGTFEVENPANGETLAHVADGGRADAVAALDAASSAQAEWAATSPRLRAELLRAAFEAVTVRADEFAQTMTAEMGKPLAEARGEVAYGAEFLRWFSEIAAHVTGRYGRAPEGTLRLMTLKRPVGPCLLITPWNFPLAMGTRKIAPALAAGCTVVIKPARQTPLTTALFVQVLDEVGVPAGVVNMVTAADPAEVSEPLLADPRLRKLSFTGSTAVGRHLLAAAADGVLRVSMELGGNAPFVVFEDADVDAAVAGAMAAKLRNMGEACTAANRFIVHESVREEFATKLAEKMGALTVGDGAQAGTDIGPLIDAAALAKVESLVDDALAHGARVLTGGKAEAGPGYFYPPTVLDGVGGAALLWTEEIFGPVAPIASFSQEAEAIELANATEFGLVSYAYTADVSRALRLTERLESGMIGVNVGVVSNAAAPFGGIKQSGVGREGSAEGIEEYLENVYVGFADPFA